jgi:hypothetical protein
MISAKGRLRGKGVLILDWAGGGGLQARGDALGLLSRREAEGESPDMTGAEMSFVDPCVHIHTNTTVTCNRVRHFSRYVEHFELRS